MADEADTTEGKEQETSEGDGKKTAQSDSGAETQTADKSGADERKFTQADLDNYLKKKTPQLRKQILRELAQEEDKDKPTLEELQHRAEAAEGRLRVFEAREQIEDYVSDKRNNVQIRNVKALFRYIKNDLEFDDDGKATNLKDLITQAKQEAPELFQAATGSADGGSGARGGAQVSNFNSMIRAAAGRQ